MSTRSKRSSGESGRQRRPPDPPAPPAPTDPVSVYARGVLAGELVTGRLVRLACERHLRDLDTGQARGLTFNAEDAQHAIDFFKTFLILPDGQAAGEPFALLPFGEFIVGSLFGWKGRDGFRRFRTAYIEIAKGSAKTPIAAGVGLYMLTMDNETGAQVFTAATTRDQAGVAFRDATRIPNAALRRHLEILPLGQTGAGGNISHPSSDSFMRPVSSEAHTLEGKRVHCAVIDELQIHESAEVTNAMKDGVKARRQPLILEITNSGFDRHSVCWAHREYSQRVLEGAIAPGDGDAWFAYVCQLDPCATCRAAGKDAPTEGCAECDDWRDERVWLKTNPALPHTPGYRYLREQVAEAVGMPSKTSEVKRKNFCCWTESVQRWIAADAWAACGAMPVALEDLRGRRCIAGLDLSTTTDLSALVLLFRADDGSYDVLPFFWCPLENVRLRSHRDHVPYLDWLAQGALIGTEGNVVDYDAIEEHIAALPEEYGIEIAELAFDPWNATQLITRLQALGVRCVPIRQGYPSLSAPTKELEKLVKEQRIRHGNQPVLAWNIANVVTETDPSGNIKPSKRKSTERIDGVSALVTALARCIAGGGDDGAESDHYETHTPLMIG